MVKIRLTRVGAKKSPHYRLMAIDSRKQRDGRALEYLGTYDPNKNPAAIDLKTDAIDAWMAKGAQMSHTVRSLVKRARSEAVATPEAGAS
jgi:small subunit ribosomal protein S16